MNVRDQKRYVDLFERRVKTPEGIALCQYNSVYGLLYTRKALHRLQHVRKLVARDLSGERQQMWKEKRREWCQKKRELSAYNREVKISKMLGLVPPSDKPESTPDNQEPDDAKTRGVIVRMQDVEKRHATASATNNDTVLFDYPVELPLPKIVEEQQVPEMVTEDGARSTPQRRLIEFENAFDLRVRPFSLSYPSRCLPQMTTNRMYS